MDVSVLGARANVTPPVTMFTYGLKYWLPMPLKRLLKHRAVFTIKASPKKLADHLFAVRNAVDPADAYRAFRDRDAEVDAQMRDRGFPIQD